MKEERRVHVYVLINAIDYWNEKKNKQNTLIWKYKSVDDHFFDRCSNLSNNKLRDIREGTFDGAGGVLELLLTGNKLTGLQGRMFRGLVGLKTLWVFVYCVCVCVCFFIVFGFMDCSSFLKTSASDAQWDKGQI